MITPNDLEVLVHFFTSPEPHPRREAPAVVSTIKKFVSAGIIQPYTDTYILTERGKVWLEKIRSVPYPEQKWV